LVLIQIKIETGQVDQELLKDFREQLETGDHVTIRSLAHLVATTSSQSKGIVLLVDEAIQALEGRVEQASQDEKVAYIFSLSKLYQRQGLDSQAIEARRQALEPRTSPSYLSGPFRKDSNSKVVGSSTMPESVVRLADPRTRAGLVAEHQVRGDLTQAIAALREASKLAKDDILIQFQLALLEVYADDREGFEKHCAFLLENIAANVDDSDRCLIVLALTLREDTTDEWNQAVAWAEKALAADPARHWKHRALAAALMRAGRTDEALESLTSDDRQLDVLGEQMRSILLARLGRISEAKQSEEIVRQLTNASHSPRPQKPFGELTYGAWWDWYEYEIRESELESLLRNSPTESSAN
jgi:tetratricopeptide (TPR) repeat protein